MRKLAIFAVLAMLSLRLAAGEAAEVTGMDHIPIALRDLDGAAQTYENLGFVLKEGRFHRDGITNKHVKFPNGSELELISVAKAQDKLTVGYQKFLSVADGPAYLGLFAPSRSNLTSRLAAFSNRYESEGRWISFPQSNPLNYLFFAQRNASATDEPQHFAHPNSAEALIGVWLAGDDFKGEEELFALLGGKRLQETACTPKCDQRTSWRFSEGEITLLPSSSRIVADRKIVGAVIQVRSLETAKKILESRHLKLFAAKAERWESLFIPPEETHGIWLEFRQLD